MKKLLLGLAATVVSAGFLGGGVASASAEFYKDGETTYRCENGVLINNETNQEVTTGNAETDEGDASSGDASNDNKTLIDVVASCAAQVAKKEDKQPEKKVDEKEKENGEVLGEAAEKEQAVAPVGGVDAGAGSGSAGTSAAIGLLGSVVAIAAGIVARKRAVLN